MSMDGGSFPVVPWVPDIPEQVVTNLIPCPSFETGVGAWGTFSSGTLTTSATGAFSGSSALTATPGSPGVTDTLVAYGSSISDWIPVLPDTVYTFSAYLKNAFAGLSVNLSVIHYDSGGSHDGSTAGHIDPIGTTQERRLVICSQTLSAVAFANPMITYNTQSAGLGIDCYVDAVMLTKGPTVWDYFDGDTPDDSVYRYDWLGTPHASASTRTVL